jgi:hypothetical protein
MEEVGERGLPPELQVLHTGENIHLIHCGPTVMSCMYHPDKMRAEFSGGVLNYGDYLLDTR